jgi:transcriptional regulator with XRE-family HTH domain
MGKRFKQLREAAGLSQAALARASGIPLKTYLEWEHGRRTPLLDAAAKVADALGVSLDLLAGRPTPPAPPAEPPPEPPKRGRKKGGQS